MGDINAEALRILSELGLDGSGDSSVNDEADRILAELGLDKPKEEGTDFFQPVRTFFGETQGSLARLASGTEAYQRAQEAKRQGLGVTPESPWYEQSETLPGVGDVLAEYVPEAVRESLPGKAVGPALRLVGNIAGDPTTYLGGIAAKGGMAAARGIPEAAAAMDAGEALARGLASAGAGAEAVNAARIAAADKVAKLVLEKGSPLQQRAYTLARAGQEAPHALGLVGAAAFLPETLKGAYEAWTERVPAAEGVGENVAETSNAILQTGLSILMGKGVIDTGRAIRAARTHMAEHGELAGAIGAADEAIANRAAELPLQPLEEPGAITEPTPVPAAPAAARPEPAAPLPNETQRVVLGPNETQPVRILGPDDTQAVEIQARPEEPPAPVAPEPQPEAPLPPTPAALTPEEAAARQAAVEGPRPPESDLEAQLRASIEAAQARKAAAAAEAAAGAPEPAGEALPPPAVVPEPPAKIEPTPEAAPPPTPEPIPAQEAPIEALAKALDGVDDELKASPVFRQALTSAPESAHGAITTMLLDPQKRAALAQDIAGKTPRQILTLIKRRTAAKKVVAVEEKQDAFQRTKQLLDIEKVPVKQFVEDLPEFEFEGPGKTKEGGKPVYTFSGKIRDAYMEYLRLREGGMERAAAIKLASKVKPQFQNYISAIERMVEKSGVGRYGAEEDAAALAAGEGAPLATKEQLRQLKGQLDSRFPALKLPEESVETFTARMSNNPEMLTLLSDYNRFLELRKNIKGAHTLGDARIIQLAKDLGISVRKSPAVQREVIPAILRKLGVTTEAQRELQRQAETQLAATIQRQQARPFEPGSGFTRVVRQGKEQANEYRSTNGTEIHIAGTEKKYTATLADFTDEAGLAKDLEALAKDPGLDRIVVTDFPKKEGALPRRGIKAAKALEAAGFSVLPDQSPDAPPVYVKPKKVAGMGSRLTTDELMASLKQTREDPIYKQLVEMVEEAIDQQRQAGEPAAIPDPSFWHSFKSTPKNLQAPWDILAIPEVVNLTSIPPFDMVKKAAMLGASDAGFIKKLSGRLKAKGITGVNEPTAAPRVMVDTTKMLGADYPLGYLTGKTREHNGRKFLQVEVPLYTESGESRFDWWPESQLKRVGMEKAAPTYKAIASGSYHGLWEISGAKDAEGHPVVMRVGFAPMIPLKPSQEALLAPVIDYGIMPTEVGPLHYTVHRKGQSPAVLMSGSVDETGRLGGAMAKLNFKGVPVGFDQSIAEQTRKNVSGKLPPGITFTDFRDDMVSLFERLDEEKMAPLDTDASYGESMARGDQLAYLPLGPKEEAPGGVVRTGSDGRRWHLVVTDRGAFIPREKTGPWAHMHPTIALALQQRTGDRDLTPAQQRERHANYSQDAREGVKIGGKRKLVAANHDGIATDEFVIENARLGQAPAQALAGIVEDIVPALNRALGYEGPSPIDVEYGGLTTSPLMSGVYLGEKGQRGKIYTNLVEAVNHGQTYEGSIDAMLETLVHEITHDRMVAHDKNFHDFESYSKAHEAIAPKMEQYRAALKKAMPEELYNQIRRELVPEYLSMWRGHGEVVEGVRARLAESSPAPVTGGRAGAKAGAAAGGGERVQPGGALQGGAAVPAGGVRPATAARGATAEGLAEGEAAGPGGRRGAAQEDSAQAEYDALRERVAAAAARDKLDFEAAKGLLDELAEENQKAGKPPRKALEAAWDISGRMLGLYSAEEQAAMAKGLPYPRKPDQVEAAINALHYIDLPDSFKARMKLWYDLAPKEFDRSTVEHWADVEREVQNFIGLDTPEGWARAFQRRKGGLTSMETLLLRQVHNELANKVVEAEQRFAEATTMGDGALIEHMQRQLVRANENYLVGAHTLANRLTGQARGLAIAKHQIRNLNPIIRFHQDMLAALRERVNGRIKDEGRAREVTQQLMGALTSAMRDPTGDPAKWAEWWRLYRTVMQPSTMEKALEWYKAGLLGWPSRTANMGSNAIFRSVRYVEDAAAAALDAAKSALTGSERQLYLGELGASALAFKRAMAEGLPEWMSAHKRNFLLQPDDVNTIFKNGALAEDLLHGAGAIEGKLGEFVRFQLKGLNHDDALAKHLARTDFLYREIYRRFRKGTYTKKANESLTAATERMYTELNENFKKARDGQAHDVDQLKHWQKMVEPAEEHAKNETFQADLGNLGRGAQAFLRDNPFFQIFFPFIRTPTNIAKETVRRTPIGYAMLARKWSELSPAERLTEFAKPTVGTLLGGYILSEALAGNLTGAGPLDPDELEALKTTGWQPHSIKIGNRYISYSRFEPIAAVAGIAADAADGIREGDFDRWQTAALRVMQAAASNVTDKTFLAGMDNLLSAASHPEQYGRRFVKNLQGTIIPNSLGYVPVAGLQRALDPVYRQSEPLTMDVFYSKLPWMSATLEPQYGPTGEVRKRPGGRLEQLISPFSRSEQKEGPGVAGAEEIVRIQAAPSSVKSYWMAPGGVRVNLTGEERRKLSIAMQKATELIGQNLVRDPNYVRLPDSEEDPDYRYGQRTKKEVVKRIYSRYRDRVMQELRPGLLARARKAVNNNERIAEKP